MSHVIHALILGLVLFALMKYGLKQSNSMAQDRAVLIAALALVYMTLFGHRLPGKINSNIMA
jgi:hypothetical protein